jgi:hypothetical protein
MHYKRQVLLLAAFLVIFVAANFIVWKMSTEDLLTDNHYVGGDLARLGYYSGSKDCRKNSNDLPRRHVSIKNYSGGKVDMITIGDSFTNGGAGGKNAYYQDYIASINGFNVLNINRQVNLDVLTISSILLNNGFFDTFKPRYLLISMAERGCGDIAGTVDFDRNVSQKEMAQLKIVDYFARRPHVSFINDGNMKFVLYSILRRFSDHAFFNEVYVGKMREPLFSVRCSKDLLFFKYKKFLGKEEVARLNDNLNTLADRLNNKGIRLVFLPCLDKYTLYSDFIERNPYPRSTFFEDFRPLTKRYIFIDTKAILMEEVKKGEKDIFYADDTHWSWKAAKKLFETVRFDR